MVSIIIITIFIMIMIMSLFFIFNFYSRLLCILFVPVPFWDYQPTLGPRVVRCKARWWRRISCYVFLPNIYVFFYYTYQSVVFIIIIIPMFCVSIYIVNYFKNHVVLVVIHLGTLLGTLFQIVARRWW